MSDAEDETIRRAADIIRRDYGKAAFRSVLEEFGLKKTEPEGEESETDENGNPKPPPVKDKPNESGEQREKKSRSIWWPAAEESA